MTDVFTVEWIADGFLYPAAALAHDTDRPVICASTRTGCVVVHGDTLRASDAIAVAVTQYRCAWDETPEIEVRDQANAFMVAVDGSASGYTVSIRRSAPSSE